MTTIAQKSETVSSRFSEEYRVISADNKSKKNFFIQLRDYLYWVYEKKELISVIAGFELKRSIVQTKLAYLWWLLDPLLNFFCYWFLVVVLVRKGNSDVPYALFMITAVLPWHFTQKTIQSSTTLWERYKRLIDQVRFPYLDLILASLIYETVLYSISQFIVIGVCFAYGFYPKMSWFYLPLIIFVQAFLSFGFMLFNALIAFMFYDYQKLLPFILRIWFFVSPAVWAIDMLPAQYQAYVYYNPMTIVFESYRSVLLYGHAPNWHHIELFLLFSFCVSLVGLALFLKKEPYINRYI